MGRKLMRLSRYLKHVRYISLSQMKISFILIDGFNKAHPIF
jgi:hypothetical protein